jgi:hypothetical protein
MVKFMDEIADFRDDLFGRICVALQLTPTQFQSAERSYNAVGVWLGEDERLSRLHPRIYAQGSMALLTTVKPRGRVEYDLDMILEIDGVNGLTPKWLYDAVKDRLGAHTLYRTMLEPHPRCLRLEYANQFHLDIVPARTHARLGAPFIEIPQKPDQDGELHNWITNNPKGFVKWFKSQCKKTSLIALEKAEQERLPEPVLAHEKPVLARAVQLLKRHRDVVFGNASDAPSSIVLTTLAGTFYQGESSVQDALIHILERIAQLAEADTLLTSVSNPACPDQKLCANWTSSQCAKFANFVRTFRRRLLVLATIQGVEKIAAELRSLFGDETLGQKDDMVSKAILEYVDETVNKARDSKALRFVQSGGLSTVAGAGISVPKNTFYGRKE